jgi:YggT family protein
MTSSYLTNPIVFLVQTLLGLYAILVLLRFILQWARADFYNPISQFVVKATTPALRPLRKAIPGYSGMDLAALVLAWLVKSLELAIVTMIELPEANPLAALGWALPELAGLALNILIFAIFIRVILSWINPDPYHPLAGLLDSLTEPVMGPARRLLPPVGGLDLSPVLVMVGLVLLKMLLIPPLVMVTGSPF